MHRFCSHNSVVASVLLPADRRCIGSTGSTANRPGTGVGGKTLMSLSLKNRRQVNAPLEITLGGKAVLPEQQSGNPCRSTAVLLPDRVCLQVQECQIWWDQRPSTYTQMCLWSWGDFKEGYLVNTVVVNDLFCSLISTSKNEMCSLFTWCVNKEFTKSTDRNNYLHFFSFHQTS